VSDLRWVLDTVGSQRPVLGGIEEAGAPNVMLAAIQPERVRSIVWLEPFPRVMWAPDFPWGVKSEYLERDERSLALWGTREYGEGWAEAEAAAGLTLSPENVLMAGVMSRHTATPDVARELDRIWYETDVRGVLPSVQAPVLLVARTMYPRRIEVAEYVASLMPEATVAPVPGNFGPDELGPVVDVVERFLGVEREPELDTVLATVLFAGECELIEGKAAGLTVSIGARIAASSGASEVLVSQTVKDLVAGSGFSFEDRGEHELKGIPDRWRLYRASLADPLRP